MPKKNNRPDARRDANEPEIFDALTAAGFKPHRIGCPGDLLVWNPDTRHWITLEIKVPGGRLTPKQKQYREENPDIDIPIVDNTEDAIRECYMR